MKVAHSTTSSTDTARLAPLPRRIPGASMRPVTATVTRRTAVAGKVVITTAHHGGDRNGFTHSVATYRPMTDTDVAANDGYGTEGELTLIEDAGFYTALDADRDHTSTVATLTPPLRPLPAPPLRPLAAVPFDTATYGDPWQPQQQDRIGTPAAWDAFGASASDDDNRKVIPSLPNPRKPIDHGPSAA